MTSAEFVQELNSLQDSGNISFSQFDKQSDFEEEKGEDYFEQSEN